MIMKRSYFMDGGECLVEEDWRMIRWLWHKHGIALLFFAVLSILITWPTVRHFTTGLTSSGEDARHELWLLWHTKEALLGRQPFFGAPFLFYPQGATLLTHSTGPVMGLLALPFWPFGPEAAYNGTLLLGLILSGYGMYLLARSLAFPRSIAIFAGCMVLAAPMTLAGFNLHLTKVFTGGMPIAILALLRALDPRRSRWWAAGAGAALLFVLLTNGYQFIYISLAAAFFTIAAIVTAGPDYRRSVGARSLLAAVCTLVLTGPLLFAMLQAASNPTLKVAATQDSFARPDLAQFVVPDRLSRLWSGWAQRQLEPFIDKVTIDHETAVSLPWVAMLLCVPLLHRQGRPGWKWLLFTLLCVLFALGPTLQIRGRSSFTTYDLPLLLPYAWLTSLPGLEFMRTPGRFMQIGVIGLSIAASYGLLILIQHQPRWRHVLVGAAIALLLLQNWPQPYPEEKLPPVPDFYQQIARDPAVYGVFDLPLKYADGFGYGLSYITNTSIYQMYQMTHRKGIHGGYVSRTYATHPLFADLMSFRYPDLLIDGIPAPFANFLPALSRYGYRYVVLHTDNPDAPGVASARTLLEAVFGPQPPLVQDNLATVYQVAPKPGTTEARLGSGWLPPEDGWHWAMSPATIVVDSPCPQRAVLQITPASIFSPDTQQGLGAQGKLTIQVGKGQPQVVLITVEQPTSPEITLATGSQTITLSLEAGNFVPSDYGGDDNRALSFAVRSIDLQPENSCK